MELKSSYKSQLELTKHIQFHSCFCVRVCAGSNSRTPSELLVDHFSLLMFYFSVLYTLRSSVLISHDSLLTNSLLTLHYSPLTNHCFTLYAPYSFQCSLQLFIVNSSFFILNCSHFILHISFITSSHSSLFTFHYLSLTVHLSSLLTFH